MWTAPRFSLAAACAAALLCMAAHASGEGSTTLFEMPNEAVSDKMNAAAALWRSGDDPCLRRAIDALTQQCGSMSDDVRRRLAVALSNCHLNASGLTTRPCTPDMTLLECTQSLSDVAFTTYTAFFTHADVICYFVKSELWRARTQETVHALYRSARDTTRALSSNLEAQDVMLGQQRLSLENEGKILAQEEAMLRGIASAAVSFKEHESTMRNAFDKLWNDTNKEFQFFTGLLVELRGIAEASLRLQALVIGEMMGAKSVLFYLAAVLFVRTLTALDRTAAARARCWACLVLSYVLEHFLCASTSSPRAAATATVEAIIAANSRLWVIRATAAVACILCTIFSAWTYKNYATLSYDMLVSIKEQLGALAFPSSWSQKLAMDESEGENGSEYTGEGSDDEDEEDDADSATGAAISDSERTDVLEGNPDAWGPGSPQRGYNLRRRQP